MTTTGNTASKETILKKYPNRRIYDPSKNAHVTLAEIADRVRNGEQIKIIDNKTGEDLTHVIMGQVLFETLKARPDYLPLDLVLLMIRAQDNLVKGFLTNGLPQAFQLYMEHQRRIMSGMNWMGQGYPSMPSFTNPFFPNSPQPGFSYGAPAAPTQRPGEDPETLKKEMDSLREEIEKIKNVNSKSQASGKKKKS